MTLYDDIGRSYANYRQPDLRIAAAIDGALGDAASVINVGAGAGSYEPAGKTVLAVEPSTVMIQQRPPGAAPCVQGVAESLPLESASADAVMAVLSVHHWSDLEQGLREMTRVARKRIVLLTWVPDSPPFWLTTEYFPEIMTIDRSAFPASSVLAGLLERVAGPTSIAPVPVPHDCSDGFLCSYWRRPELYLDPRRRGAISSFSRVQAEPGVSRLRADLADGTWSERYGHLLALDAMDLGYRILRAEKAG